MDRKEIGWDGVHRINATQDKEKWRAHVNTIMNFLGPSNVRNFLSSWGTISFSRRALLDGVSYKPRGTIPGKTVLFVTFISFCTPNER